MERVIYGRNPLIEVILQFRFPTILSINSIEPADFQEIIRKDFPIYQLGIENEHEIEFIAGEESFFPTLKQNTQHKNHTFIASNGKYKINLTSSFISISTVAYSRWEEMLEKFQTPLKAFIDLYSPSFFERIGLRYIDAFSKEKLGLGDKKWHDLIQTNWLGPLQSIEEDETVNFDLNIEYFLDNKVSKAKIHTGLGMLNDSSEKIFIVDSDFIHIDTIQTNNYQNVLNYLHDNSGKFIRSVIKEDLHNAMHPGELK